MKEILNRFLLPQIRLTEFEDGRICGNRNVKIICRSKMKREREGKGNVNGEHGMLKKEWEQKQMENERENSK